MPLPPALAARLAKRGLLGKKQRPTETDQEEVFAESYDDHDDASTHLKPISAQQDQDSLDKIKFMGYPGCPNKWNAYHNCEIFCLNRWGSGQTQPSLEYVEKHDKMMAKYGPLMDGWKEIYDPGVGRHFYWCTRTDQVSWLPPGHPKATLTEPASRAREILLSRISRQDQDDEENEEQDDDEDEDGDEDDDDEDYDDEEGEEDEGEARTRLRRRRDYGSEAEDAEREMDLDSDMDNDGDSDSDEHHGRDTSVHDHSRRRDRFRTDSSRGAVHPKRGKMACDLDPMDPSAYSDTPRGNWSTGLEKARGDIKESPVMTKTSGSSKISSKRR